MLIRHLLPASHRDVEVVARPDATLADVASALQPSGAHGARQSVWVDGCRTPANTPLDGSRLMSGSTLSLHPVPVEAGLADSDAGSYDAGSRVTTVPRNRTGRTPLPPEPDAVRLPDPEPAAPPVSQIGMVAMAVSVLGAGVMVMVLGSWTYAAFAVIGPLMMVANSADSRFRRRWARRRYSRFLRRDLERLRTELDVAADAERARRAVSFPGAKAALLLTTSAAPRCWERRNHDVDAFSVRIGFGTGSWEPAVVGDLAAAPDEVRLAVDDHRQLPNTALGLRLEAGQPVAIVAPAARARALARSMVAQLAACHGPADLAVATVVDPSAKSDWDWLAWLPHTVDRDGRSTLSISGPAADEMADRLAPPADGLLITVLDDPAGLRARHSAARSLLQRSRHESGGVACLVVLGPEDPVPAACTRLVRVTDDGRLSGPSVRGQASPDALDVIAAADLARGIARFDDPELLHDGRHLPGIVRLASLLGLETADPDHLVARWHRAGPDPAPLATLGLSGAGPVAVDLVADGPHALVVGTTGSGKSEALRSLVVSLAASQSPDHLVFVLIDFKGGSAFDACAELPHTVGLVTDLDDHLAARALRCLEAELRYREERFRTCGAHDISSFRRLDPGDEPMPRLVVVVDEFAVLAATLPEFVDSLVDVAQRGRSLGVHLVLATQRPGGAVTPAIRANIGLRLTLRVQSPDDSRDLIGSTAAVDLPRHTPGRALLSFGPGDVVLLQTGCASLPIGAETPPVSIRPLEIPWAPPDTGPSTEAGSTTSATDLEQLVDGLTAAWRSLGRPAPRRPWPDALPDRVAWPLASTGEPDATALTLGLADDPDRQRVVPFTWHLTGGPLLSVGLPGSGSASLAAVVVLAAARSRPAESCHAHVIDATGTALLALSGLPHVGAVVTSGEVERQRRLVQALAGELARRRAGGSTAVRRILVVHGVTSLQARWEEAGHLDCWPQLIELVAEGAGVGIHVCCTAETSSVPHRLLAACAQRVVFRLGDAVDQASLGVPTGAPRDLPFGRALALDGSPRPLLVQVASPTDGLAAAVARLSGHEPASVVTAGWTPDAPNWVGVLPDRVASDDLDTFGLDPARPLLEADGGLTVPLGLADRGLVTASLVLPPGTHGTVSGPPRSGRTTTLVAIAHAVAGLEDLRTVVVASSITSRSSSVQHPTRPSSGPWPAGVEVVDLDDALLEELSEHRGPLLVLVDDVDRVADDHIALSNLAVERRFDRHVVAAGRNDRLRARYGHWSRELRADGLGLLLTPDADLDGDLLGARLPRRPPVAMVPGRAWLTGTGAGANGFVQVVTVDGDITP